MIARPALLVAVSVALLACPGPTGDDGGADGGVDAGHDAGKPPVVHPVGFHRYGDGWPAGERVVGFATAETVLYAAADSGVYALASGETRWVQATVALGAGERPTSLSRDDLELYLTVAGASSGGVLVKRLGGAWQRVATAPQVSAYQLLKRGAEVLLTTDGGLFVASAPDGTYTKRSLASATVFSRGVSRLVAAPTQQRMFLTDGTANALWVSDDNGATWSATATSGVLRGEVRALAASGAVVLVDTTVDGQQRSETYGATFKPFAVGARANTFLFVQATQPWAGTDGGVRVSDDAGATWRDDTNGLPAGTFVRGLFTTGDVVLADTPAGPWLVWLQ